MHRLDMRQFAISARTPIYLAKANSQYSVHWNVIWGKHRGGCSSCGLLYNIYYAAPEAALIISDLPCRVVRPLQRCRGAVLYPSSVNLCIVPMGKTERPILRPSEVEAEVFYLSGTHQF
jgi:hypothetical protein